MAKAVARLDKVMSLYNGNLASIKRADAEMENGQVFALGGLATNEREVKNVKEPKDIDVAKDVFVLHATPEINYNETVYVQEDGTILDPNRLDTFSVKAGKVGRAYHLNVGDIITVANSLISGTTVKGQFVVPFADSTNAKTLKVAADWTAVGTSRLVFQVIEKETLGVGRRGLGVGQASTVLEVIKV